MMNSALAEYQLTVISLASSVTIPRIEAEYCRAVLTSVPLFEAGHSPD